MLNAFYGSLFFKKRSVIKTLRITNVIAILLLVLCLQVSAKTYAQVITLNVKNAPLNNVFREIKKQTGYTFMYTETMLRESNNVSMHVKNITLQEVLAICFANQPFTYRIINKTIVLQPKKVNLINTGNTISLPSPPPPIEIHGRVANKQGEPLQDVSILIAGTQTGTTTGSDGQFTLTAPDNKNITLEVSSVGYQKKSVNVGKRTEINIVLESDIASLSDVVVVGYGTQKRRDITGSVAVVNMKDLNSIATGSAAQALQGQASGVNVITPGMPGASSNIFVRGISSFGNTQPLVLVDGIQTDLADINAEDIESMQILKDAGAASIYGVRGSNGVIIITTKKGKLGTPVLTYNAYFGDQLPLSGNPFHILNSEDYARLSKIASPGTTLFANGLPDYIYKGPGGITGVGMEGDPAVDPSLYQFDLKNTGNNYIIQKVNKKGTNWFQEIFNPALITNHNLTASGGTERSKYLFSLEYFNQEGTLTETYLKRYSARINTEYKVKKNIKIGENAYVFYKQNPEYDNQDLENSISNAYRIMPIIPPYDIEGNFGGTFAGPGLGDASSPLATQKRTENDRNNVWDVVGNIYAEISFLKNFTARTSIGGTMNNQYAINFTFTPYNNSENNTSLNGLKETSLYNTSTTWTNTLTYNNSFGKHSLKVLAGYEAIGNYGRTLNGSSQNLFSTDFDYLALGNGTTNVTNSSIASTTTLASSFGRLDYSYNNKYLLGATVRRDGSSVFGSEKRFGVFPSFSLGWRISNENFLKNVDWVNDLKIRGSYGIMGSYLNVSPTNAFSLYGGNFTNAYYDILGTGNSLVQGVYQINLGNPQARWEQDKISNFGFDATLFEKLSVSLEYYQKSVDGLLFPLPLPYTAGGASAPVVNIGNIKNTGVDASITYKDNITQDLHFSVGTNITTYRNIVVKVPDPGYFDVKSGLSFGNVVRNQIGHPVSSFFGYDVVGLFKDNNEVSKSPNQSDAAPGRFMYRDVDGDGKITSADRTFIGNPNPDFTYSLNLGLSYKNFDFSSMFYGSEGNSIFNTTHNLTDFFGTMVGGKSTVLLNAWTPENTNTKIPKIEATSTFSTSSVPNSYYVENGSYLRLKSLILGYTLKPFALQHLGISKFRIYLQGLNLFTITKYSGLDPELGGSSSSFGVDQGNYPNNQKSLIIGLNVSF